MNGAPSQRPSKRPWTISRTPGLPLAEHPTLKTSDLFRSMGSHCIREVLSFWENQEDKTRPNRKRVPAGDKGVGTLVMAESDACIVRG